MCWADGQPHRLFFHSGEAYQHISHAHHPVPPYLPDPYPALKGQCRRPESAKAFPAALLDVRLTARTDLLVSAIPNPSPMTFPPFPFLPLSPSFPPDYSSHITSTPIRLERSPPTVAHRSQLLSISSLQLPSFRLPCSPSRFLAERLRCLIRRTRQPCATNCLSPSRSAADKDFALSLRFERRLNSSLLCFFCLIAG